MIAEKRSDRIIVVVFGGKSTKTRNAQIIKLAELGFRKLQKWVFQNKSNPLGSTLSANSRTLERLGLPRIVAEQDKAREAEQKLNQALE